MIQTVRGVLRVVPQLSISLANTETSVLRLDLVEKKISKDGDVETPLSGTLPFTGDDLRSIERFVLSAYDRNWYFHLVHSLLLNTGMRPSDCSSLRMADCLRFEHKLNRSSYAVLWVESKKTTSPRRRLIVYPRQCDFFDSWPVTLALSLCMMRNVGGAVTASDTLVDVFASGCSFKALGTPQFSREFR